jgi:putative ABC transport system permease protein
MDTLASFWNLVPITLVQGLLYAFVALGVMIPFRLLAFPDLTSEGSFPLGGCVCAALMVSGVNPALATLAALMSGMLMTILYSVNLRVLGKANVALLGMDSLLHWISPAVVTNVNLQVAVFGVLALGVVVLLLWLLSTEAGLSMRAVGANAALAPSLAINPWTWILAGLALANGLSALAGAVAVQLQGFADIHMGFGVLINGLAAVIIGETILGRQTVLRQVAAPVVGSLVYYQLVSLGLALGLKPADLKLATGIFVLVTLAIPAMRRGAEPERMRE